MSPAPTVPALMSTLAAQGGRPALTWYGPGGERVELSGAVLDNWVTKTANLLAEEFASGPSMRVLLDLPTHWRTTVWALGAWRAGAHLLLEADGRPDLVVTDRPDTHPQAPELVAVALAALAREFPGPLPAGAVDAASAVMTYGDVLTWMPEPVPGAPAATAGGRTVSHEDLLAWALEAPEAVAAGPADRVLLTPWDDANRAATLRAVVGVLARGASAVLCHPEVSATLAADGERRARLVETEQVTAVP